MNNFKTLIKKTGLSVEVLTQGYDSKKKLYYSCCVFGSSLCYIELSDDTKRITVCKDDKNTINNIKQILGSKKNNVVSYRQTKKTEYYMYCYMLECDTKENS